MSQLPQPFSDRIMELLADEAMGQIVPADALELERLLDESGARSVPDFENVIAVTDGAMHAADGAREAMPADVAVWLKRAADAFCAGQAIAIEPRAREAEPRAIGDAGSASQDRPVVYMNWQEDGRAGAMSGRRWGRLAVAAVVAIGAGLGLYGMSRPATSTIVESRTAMLTKPDVTLIAWNPWPVEGQSPQVPGVVGDVVWSNVEQKGYMRFTGLPVNDPKAEQYQLWIIDAERGMEQRISGAIFDGGSGEVVVAIEPRLLVNKAAAFAVTVEKPGGTWVSDMTRRVAIASVK